MHVELELRFKKPVRWEETAFALKEIIGANAVTVSEAVERIPIAQHSNIVSAALVAESILNVAKIVYVPEGSDAIRVLIIGPSIAEAKKQCARIARQIANRIGTLSSATASVFVVEHGRNKPLITGERMLFWLRIRSGLAERLATRLIPSATTFALASYFCRARRLSLRRQSVSLQPAQE